LARNIASKPLTLVIKTPIKRREAQTTRVLPANKISEINDYIMTAKSYRDRGAYAEALVALQAAVKIDPNNKDVHSEIAITRRGCNAEKTLGRFELKC
jgi:Tfp pilus assembly protein PilF